MRQAAEERHGRAVPAIVARVRDDVVAARQDPAQRHQRGGQPEAERE